MPGRLLPTMITWSWFPGSCRVSGV